MKQPPWGRTCAAGYHDRKAVVFLKTKGKDIVRRACAVLLCGVLCTAAVFSPACASDAVAQAGLSDALRVSVRSETKRLPAEGGKLTCSVDVDNKTNARVDGLTVAASPVGGGSISADTPGKSEGVSIDAKSSARYTFTLDVPANGSAKNLTRGISVSVSKDGFKPVTQTYTVGQSAGYGTEATETGAPEVAATPSPAAETTAPAPEATMTGGSKTEDPNPAPAETMTGGANAGTVQLVAYVWAKINDSPDMIPQDDFANHPVKPGDRIIYECYVRNDDKETKNAAKNLVAAASYSDKTTLSEVSTTGVYDAGTRQITWQAPEALPYGGIMAVRYVVTVDQGAEGTISNKFYASWSNAPDGKSVFEVVPQAMPVAKADADAGKTDAAGAPGTTADAGKPAQTAQSAPTATKPAQAQTGTAAPAAKTDTPAAPAVPASGAGQKDGADEAGGADDVPESAGPDGADKPEDAAEPEDEKPEEPEEPVALAMTGKASVKSTGSRVLPLGGSESITCQVDLVGLDEGMNYTLSARLYDMDAEQIVAGTDGDIAIQSEKDGTASRGMTFGLDSRTLAGHRICVIAELTDADGNLLADLKPSAGLPLHAVAAVSADASMFGSDLSSPKVLRGGTKGAITAGVSLSGLVPGNTYGVAVMLMDRQTGMPAVINGKGVALAQSVTPDGTADALRLTMDLDLAGVESGAYYLDVDVYDGEVQDGKTPLYSLATEQEGDMEVRTMAVAQTGIAGRGSRFFLFAGGAFILGILFCGILYVRKRIFY